MSGPIPAAIRTAIQHCNAGRASQAIEVLRQHLRRTQNDPEAQSLLGTLLVQGGQIDQGLFFMERAAAAGRNPAHWRALASALWQCRGPEAAEKTLRASPVVRDKDPEALALWGDLLERLGRARDAADAYRAALNAAPRHPRALRGLAPILARAGRTDESIALLESAAAASPDSTSALALLCLQLNYSSSHTPGQVFAAHRRLYETLQRGGASTTTPAPPKSPPAARPLNVGFVSADLRKHAVAHFIEPILEHLDRARFKVIAFATSPHNDAVAQRLRAKCDAWHDVPPGRPGALPQAIASDRPDILVDLGGLTGPMSVLQFAQRLAPIQATYLGYPNTTGVPSVDWRLVDAATDPIEPFPDGSTSDQLATERLLRIDGCFLCYRPHEEAPPPAPRPDGPLVFGSFNLGAKISPECVRLWSQVLQACEGSTLLIKGRGMGDPWVQDNFHAAFAAGGVDATRIRFAPRTETTADHLNAYGQVDIALDTFPYHGTTTTCEALWMGVPVVSLVGNRHAARVGLSLLNALGLPDLAAATPAQFIETAAALARDSKRRAALRQGLREQVRTSALCDEAAFVRRFEASLLRMWQESAK